MKKIVFTGGGTAGHIMPNLALIDELKTKAKVYYIGSNGMEKEIITKTDIPFYEISSVKFKRSLSFSNLLIPFKLLKAIKQSKKILKELKPDVIFNKGGYVSLPVVFAGKQLKIKIISHESDMTLGLANKLCKNKSEIICTSFEKTAESLKNGLWTGSPIRNQIFKGNKENAKKLFENFKPKPTILVVGGSLGSKIINENIVKCLDNLKEYNIIHLVGKNNLTGIKKNNYVELEFSNNIEDLYALADLVISRAGSNVINEILALNKLNLLIPLSKKASRGDQILNANYFKEKGYSNVLYEENLTPTTLLNSIKQTFLNKNKYLKNMKSTNTKLANKKIIELLLK